MLCIAAFIVFLILGIFSAYYRSLAVKAWSCVLRRVTFRPCDMTLAAELKGNVISGFFKINPKLGGFMTRWIEWFAFGFVVLSIWSLWSVSISGLNLMVYDTCDPKAEESCALGGEACTISVTSMSFIEAIQKGQVLSWAQAPFLQFGDTVSRIPSRFKTWEPKDYITEKNTFKEPLDTKKPYALEIIDPLCTFCQKLYKNIDASDFAKTHNLTYILYSIPSHGDYPYRFRFSHMVASYVEAIKLFPPEKPISPVSDWEFLHLLFTEPYQNTNLQEAFRTIFEEQSARNAVHMLLLKVGYTEEETKKVDEIATSQDVEKKLLANKDLVENTIRTIKIPTIMFGGRRWDRVLSPEQLVNN